MQAEISFGVWLRKQRRALDLSRQAFADQVGCAEVTLRRIEAGTLKPSKELASILLEKIGIPEAERTKWISFARGLSGFPLPAKSPNKPITNLPAPLTTFIGREKEQADVIKLIIKFRLVTLTGSGGVGKTRLSMKVGKQIAEDYLNGVWLVELAPIDNPSLVLVTAARTFGLHEDPKRLTIDILCDYLRDKIMLLILDNCEHVLDACAQLADTLLKRCADLKILATSREALSILGEAVYRVPSLALPDIQQVLEEVRDYESVRLFEERAQLAQMDFSLTIENISSIAKICRRLDGIPLAIELAAARVNMFSTEEIAERLQNSFDLLVTGNRTALPRHQTLHAAIDWSYDLLSSSEQSLFRRLSVFVNGWTLEAAEVVCSDVNIKPQMIWDSLTQLINKSLVIAKEIHGKPRYRMLETIRQYANERLIETAERDLLRDRHLECFLNIAETAEPHLIRSEQIEWLPLLEADYENLRQALEWALSKEKAQPVLNLCKALVWFWNIRFYWLEGSNWLTRALAKPSQGASKSEKVARMRALSSLVLVEWNLSHLEQMLSPAQESLALALEISDKRDIAIAKFCVGLTLVLQSRIDQGLPLLEESFAEFQVLTEPFWQALSFPSLGFILADQDKLSRRDVYPRWLELAHKAGERSLLVYALWEYADWLLRNNRVNEARECAEESERLSKELGSENADLNPLIFAEIAWLEGDTKKARSLYLEMEERFRLHGDVLFRSRCASALGRLAMEDGDLNGARTYHEQAIMLALEGGWNAVAAICLSELGSVFYLQGSFEAFKQNVKESFSLLASCRPFAKVAIMINILGSLYVQHPAGSARLLGAIDNYEKVYDVPRHPLKKRYCDRVEAHVRKLLGEPTFDFAFREGQKMSLDEGLNLALKTVEEI
jgi:non-specific serine/threonine protein kinase